MLKHPGDYPWSSFAFNALGKDDVLLTPHPLYNTLVDNPEKRYSAYRALFEQRMSERKLAEIRDATNKAWVLGGNRFQEEIERLLQRQAKPQARGGDRRSDKVKKQKTNRV